MSVSGNFGSPAEETGDQEANHMVVGQKKTRHAGGFSWNSTQEARLT